MGSNLGDLLKSFLLCSGLVKDPFFGKPCGQSFCNLYTLHMYLQKRIKFCKKNDEFVVQSFNLGGAGIVFFKNCQKNIHSSGSDFREA